MSAYTDALNLAKHAQAFTREQWKHETNISATAHQREVTDLKKAGLNPVLSSGGSGASYTSTNIITVLLVLKLLSFNHSSS